MILIMTTQVLFFNNFSEKDPHFNVVEIDALFIMTQFQQQTCEVAVTTLSTLQNSKAIQ